MPPPPGRFDRSPDALAVLALGPAAVPELAALLVDPRRRRYAAALLGEIGGAPAAQALLARFREHRRRHTQQDVVTLHATGARTVHQRDEPGDGGFHGEVLHALCLCALPVSAEVALDTTAAMDEAERLRATGALLTREVRGEGLEGVQEVSSNVEPVETAREGLHILGMTGAPEAVGLFERALRSPIPALSWAAVSDVRFLGRGQDRTLPALGALLEDPRLRGQAISAIAWLLDRAATPPSPTPTEEAALAARYRQRLQDLGHLPK